MFAALRSVITSLAIASAIGSAAQAYAASSAASSPSSARITTAGLSIQDVRYQTSQTFVNAVTFRATSSSTHISIRLNPQAGWISCTNVSGEVRCPTGSFPASAVEQLAVSAS